MKRYELEALADAERRKAVLSNGEYAEREIVGLGFKFSWSMDVLWIQLPNSSVEPEHQFVVSDADLSKAILDLKAGLSIVQAQGAEAAYLWHSHPTMIGPSDVDCREFNGGLFECGFVYHSPTRTTSRYDSNGEIDRVKRSTLVTTRSTP